MTDAERAYIGLILRMYGWGLEIALQRLGMASVLMGGDGEQSAFAPFLGLSGETERPTVH